MKKGALFILVLLTSLSIASAQGLSGLLNELDEGTVILYGIFIIAFAVIFFALGKSVFKDNKQIAGIISVVIAFLITFGISKTGFDFQGILFDWGISSGVIMTVLPLIILAGVIFGVVKLKGNSFFVFGALLIGASFFVYEKTLPVVLGVILLIVGVIFRAKGGGKGGGGTTIHVGK